MSLHTAPYYFAIAMSFYASVVMAYIAMAASIGPWIAPTLIMMIYFFLELYFIRFPLHYTAYVKAAKSDILAVVCSASIGGIAATACGFSFPALYFLDPQQYDQLLHSQTTFFCVLAGLVLTAGLFGFAIAHFLKERFLNDQTLTFPIGKVIATAIDGADQQKNQKKKLIEGGLFFGLFAWLNSLLGVQKITLPALPSIKLPAFVFDLSVLPMLVSVGFVTGSVIARPLLTGIMLKYFVIDTVRLLFFNAISSSDFILAFGAGMVLSGFFSTLQRMPTTIKQFFLIFWQWYWTSVTNQTSFKNSMLLINPQLLVHSTLFLLFFVWWAWFVGFSFSLGFYLLVGTYVCVYQMILIGGTMGIAPLGRFATFVMVPALFLFEMSYMQIILIATFVEVAGGVAVDVLFGQKAQLLTKTCPITIMKMQLFGIGLAAIGCTFAMYILTSRLALGSIQLGAYKAQARALLVTAGTFDYGVVCVGILGGWIVQGFKINPGMVLGGLLMPIDYSLGLLVGSLIAHFTKNKDLHLSFASGVYTANSLWMVFKALLG
ncbi:hypothetical protein IPH25_01895 [bacterium]|nr:MAG: hypothetical protein IPG37_04025 [bacterium]QQR62178.1 MAG: hypothetical protein IPH25_01895 [bacterium]QQR63264.1 MAG: hypothetical protein IPH67_02205 [bacterium]